MDIGIVIEQDRYSEAESEYVKNIYKRVIAELMNIMPLQEVSRANASREYISRYGTPQLD